MNIDTARFFDDAGKRVADDSENVVLLPHPVLPHSRGEIVLDSADPTAQPAIRMNYYDDPRDMQVMVAAIRRAMDIASHWPGNRRPGPVMIPPFLAEKYGYRDGDVPSDALLEEFTLHFSLTVYHPTSTCRIGSVVDPQLRVRGGRPIACGGRERHAGGDRRKHECADDYDWREGCGDDRRRAWDPPRCIRWRTWVIAIGCWAAPASPAGPGITSQGKAPLSRLSDRCSWMRRPSPTHPGATASRRKRTSIVAWPCRP